MNSFDNLVINNEHLLLTWILIIENWSSSMFITLHMMLFALLRMFMMLLSTLVQERENRTVRCALLQERENQATRCVLLQERKSQATRFALLQKGRMTNFRHYA
jgi:hypothetical protein